MVRETEKALIAANQGKWFPLRLTRLQTSMKKRSLFSPANFFLLHRKVFSNSSFAYFLLSRAFHLSNSNARGRFSRSPERWAVNKRRENEKRPEKSNARNFLGKSFYNLPTIDYFNSHLKVNLACLYINSR